MRLFDLSSPKRIPTSEGYLRMSWKDLFNPIYIGELFFTVSMLDKVIIKVFASD
jgi:hypothetical protein